MKWHKRSLEIICFSALFLIFSGAATLVKEGNTRIEVWMWVIGAMFILGSTVGFVISLIASILMAFKQRRFL